MSTDWFEVRDYADGVYGIGEPGHSERVKSYLVEGRDLALLFDTGMGIGGIRAVVEQLTALPVLVVNSHAHWDHIGDNWQFERIWIHEAEAEALLLGVPNERLRRSLSPESFSTFPPERFDLETFSIPPSVSERRLTGGETIDLGDRLFQVVNTPGHSSGGISLIEERTGIALVGDAVYAGPLYAHLPGSDPAVYRETLRQLAQLAPALATVYPSHGEYPQFPKFLTDVFMANESVWGGREPDSIDSGVERHVFDHFSILLRIGWQS